MTVTIGHLIFDRVRYDADADVLYLHIGDPEGAVEFDETPEGHAVRLDADGQVVGLTLVGARRLLEENGEVQVTLPVPKRVSAGELLPAFAA